MNDTVLQDQVCVFYGRVTEFAYADCLALLSEKEFDRAMRFRLESDKHRYVVSRAILKQLLTHFLQQDEIEIAYTKLGKPFLYHHPEFKFNLAHSDNAFVIACSHDEELGIDVENLNTTRNISSLQNYVFTHAELNRFNTIPADCKQAFFINSWTRKEALLKATGNGLTRAMNTFDVSFAEDTHFLSEKEHPYSENKTDLFLESRTLMNHYRVAVAVKGRIKAIDYTPVRETGIVI